MIQKPSEGPEAEDQPAVRPGEGAPARELSPKNDPEREGGKTEAQESHRKVGNPAQRQLPRHRPTAPHEDGQEEQEVHVPEGRPFTLTSVGGFRALTLDG
jgi:hypothetical protein